MSDWPDRLCNLRVLLADKLDARGANLGSQLRWARRRLPRQVRREAEYLAQAEQIARHPKFARLIDPRAVSRAHGRLARHLDGVDLATIRRNRRKDRAATLALYVLVTFALVVAMLWWRGLA